MSADRLFGRHCRCFLASPVKPQTPVSVDDRIQPSVVIKDSWTIYNTAPNKDDATDLEAEVNGLYIDDDNNSAFAWPSANPSLNTRVKFDEMRNEICTLSRINKALGVNPQLDGLYPKLLCGGWVCQPTDTGQTFDSTGDIMFALNREQQDKTPFCLHVRYAMEPIGHPLKYLKSASELVVVLYDAMRCHKAINDSCNILHRDISDNNILVVRNGSRIHGLLIDFDCAIDRSAERQHVHPERTGTLPFMSIGNLENSSVQRTMLDDWESLLYLVCWFGTFGVNGNCNDINCKHHINMWCVGDEDEIAALKRSDLTNIGNFEDNITGDFGKHDSNGADDVNKIL
ncbi:hypothetical protein IWW48_004566 [Coemansia sp. RSA 1200]|nr:hypothetical protein IWW48_004566 [Coemansia sp. RSA 1200]